MAQGIEARPQRTALGISIILASVLTMAFADAVVKLVSAEMTVWQVFAARAFVAIPILIALLLASGAGLKPRDPAWAFFRSGLLVCAWLAYYASLPVLSLSVAAVAVYTGPIIIALLSAALIGEPVSARQWGGVLLGFLGVLLTRRFAPRRGLAIQTVNGEPAATGPYAARLVERFAATREGSVLRLRRRFSEVGEPA